MKYCMLLKYDNYRDGKFFLYYPEDEFIKSGDDYEYLIFDWKGLFTW